MTQTPRFCERCGTALEPGARFCGQCGHAVQPILAQATAPPLSRRPSPPEAEPVIGVIPGAQRRKGLLGYQTFNVVVTPGRLVFALMTQKMMNDAVREASEEAKRQGKGLLERMTAQMGWLNIMVQRYEAMPVQAALAEQPDNFFIPNNQIRKVRVERREDRQRHTHSDHLIIEATSGKHEFELKSGQPAEARHLLQQVLGAVVR